MAKGNHETINDSIEQVKLLKNELTSSRLRKNFDKAIVDIKRIYDKLYYLAYFDAKYEICNLNRLAEDIKGLENPNFDVVSIYISSLETMNLIDYDNYEKIKQLITSLKKQFIVDNSNHLVLKNIYISNNRLLFCVNKKSTEMMYGKLKKYVSQKISFLRPFVVFARYNNLSSKINKNIDTLLNDIMDEEISRR